MAKNVLFIDTHNIFGGGQQHLLRLLSGIDKKEFFPIVLCSEQNQKFIEGLKKINIEFISIKSKIVISENKILKTILQSPNFFYSIFKTAQIIKNKKIDILQANLFYSAIFGAIAASFFKKPFIWTIHIPEDITKYKIITKFLIALSAKITPSCNDFLKVAKENGFNMSKFKAIYPGLKLEDYQIKQITDKLEFNGKKITKPIIAMVARLDPIQKRYQDFIEAAEIVLKEIKEPNFLIVGGATNYFEENQKKELENLVKEKGFSHKIIFTGFFPDLNYLLSNTQILALPSLEESIPAIVLEAMAMKIPVVATKVGGIPEAVLDGETGFLVSVKNPQSLAEKIIYLLKNPERAKKMGEKGYQRVKEEFRQEKLAKECQKVFNDLLKQ